MKGIFLDTETSGLNPRVHTILEIALVLIDLLTGKRLSRYEALLRLSSQEWAKGDPSSLKVNGFNWETTSRGREASEVAQELLDFFATHDLKRKKAVFICQNPSFDRAFFGQLIDPDTQELLLWPYHWLDLASMHWALSIEKAKQGSGPFPWDTGLSKDQIASYYQLPKEAKPHRAMNGVEHLLLCYEKVVGYPNRTSN